MSYILVKWWPRDHGGSVVYIEGVGEKEAASLPSVMAEKAVGPRDGL